MKKQIENIDRFGQAAVYEHIQFFQGVRHRAKGRQKHPDGQQNYYRKWYFIEQ
jgi:hypothetical protein